MNDTGWPRMGYQSWSDPTEVRARLAAGADPNAAHGLRPLHEATERGSAEVVSELARLVDDVDAEHDGRTALWAAVHAGRPDNARALVAAGADPWRPMMAGWSPGRLSLASPTPDLFPRPPGFPGLTEAETAAVAEARRLTAALADLEYDGLSLCCAAGIDATEAARRLLRLCRPCAARRPPVWRPAGPVGPPAAARLLGPGPLPPADQPVISDTSPVPLTHPRFTDTLRVPVTAGRGGTASTMDGLGGGGPACP